MTLPARLLSRIAATGPIPFEEYMAECLYGTDGFFTTGPVRSTAAGDFLTSPEVSPWFGRAVGRFLAADLGEVRRFVEVGAGSGSLLTALSAEIHPDEIWAVEASPTARRALGHIVGPDRVTERLDDLPPRIDGAIVANELIDNLPVALAVRTADGWMEHAVGAPAGGLAFVAVPARPEVAGWADAFGGEVPIGGIVEVQLAAAGWLRAALGRIGSGTLVLIDYGGTVEELEPRRSQGTLRTYRSHHLGPDPLLEPGATDITVDVNFTAIEAAAGELGAATELWRQDDFLTRWGVRDAVSELRHRELAAARSGDTMTQLARRSERIAAETLLHPRGLGDFRVFIARLPPHPEVGAPFSGGRYTR